MPDFFYEDLHGRKNNSLVCGIDEVGRGPLAGPVVAACVIIPFDFPLPLLTEINDSKKLSAVKRERLYDSLTAACPFAVAESSVQEIDSLNILQAALLAMKRSFDALSAAIGSPISAALIDGNKSPALPCTAVTIIGGDSKSLSISAASIIAKVHRDRLMQNLSKDFPEYGWDKNAGYGTKHHLDALNQFGRTIHHRLSFAPVKNSLKK
ncbi:MAG: ribonuclease HII [Alphaproteobacteria bacterium]|nr:ribonuclease HII [Alphaproteobacteria bacterium]